ELGSKRPGWVHPSADWVREAARLAAVEGKLPAVLAGTRQPDGPAEPLNSLSSAQGNNSMPPQPGCTPGRWPTSRVWLPTSARASATTPPAPLPRLAAARARTLPGCGTWTALLCGDRR